MKSADEATTNYAQLSAHLQAYDRIEKELKDARGECESARGTLAVLRKEGLTETGPNNCMAQEWSTTDYLPAIVAPALNWKGGRWTPRTNS